MTKYIPINAVMNQIAKVVKEDEDELQLVSWANDMYRLSRLPYRYELKYALIDVISYKATLPDDILRITDVRHSIYLPDDNIRTMLLDYGDSRLIISQQIFFSSPYYNSFRPVRYKGQNRGSLIDENIYCRNHCEIQFSIDSTMKCMTIDLADGEILIEYMSAVKDESGNILIPDDTDLLRGLALYAESQYWRNKAASHEALAYKFYQDNLAMSTTLLTKFRGKKLLDKVNVEGHNEFVFGRNRINYNNNYRQTTRR